MVDSMPFIPSIAESIVAVVCGGCGGAMGFLHTAHFRLCSGGGVGGFLHSRSVHSSICRTHSARTTPRKSRTTTPATTRCAAEPPPLYLDDEFGGFKGIRRSEESDSWASWGVLVEVHERSGTRCYTRSWGSPGEVAVADVLVLPGWPSPCYLAREAATRAVSLTPGLRVVSFDWPGIGESDAPQDGLKGFNYDRGTMLESVRAVAQYYGLGGAGSSGRSSGTAGRRLMIVAQGYLATDIGIALATELNADALMLFTPALGGAAGKLPVELRKLRNPLFGPLLTGNPAHMADKVFSSSTPYAIEEKTMMVLRSPFLRAGGPGFAARATACNLDWAELANDSLEQLLTPTSEKDTRVHFIITSGDKWLDYDAMKQAIEQCKSELGSEQVNVNVTDWEYSGHFCLEDAPEDCAKLISNEVNSIL